MRSKTSLDSSHEVAHGYGVNFINCLYLIPLIINQNFCATSNQIAAQLHSGLTSSASVPLAWTFVHCCAADASCPWGSLACNLFPCDFISAPWCINLFHATRDFLRCKLQIVLPNLDVLPLTLFKCRHRCACHKFDLICRKNVQYLYFQINLLKN